MKYFFFFFLISTTLLAEEIRPLILEIKTKEVMDVFRDKKDEVAKTKAIMDFIASLKPLCLQVAKVKWKEIASSELKKMDKDVGKFIAGMNDYQIKFRSDIAAKLTSNDLSEIRRICREIEKHSLN